MPGHLRPAPWLGKDGEAVKYKCVMTVYMAVTVEKEIEAENEQEAKDYMIDYVEYDPLDNEVTEKVVEITAVLP